MVGFDSTKHLASFMKMLTITLHATVGKIHGAEFLEFFNSEFLQRKNKVGHIWAFALVFKILHFEFCGYLEQYNTSLEIYRRQRE